MGVSGSGKTTVGAALADALGVDFGDADEFHPPQNIAKMAAGTPLTDADRRPWLDAIGRWLARHVDTGGVATCSALKRSYRDALRQRAPSVCFVHLAGDQDLIAERVGARPHHFMPATLLDSQFDTLEPLQADECGVVVDAGRPLEAIVDTVIEQLSR